MPDHSAANADYILCPFRISIDTREQTPFTFQNLRSDARHKSKPLIIQTIETTLATGDYSIDGLESLISIERKSVADFYGTILGDRERFERELERLQAIAVGFPSLAPELMQPGYAEIVCEGDWYTDPPTRPGDTEADTRRKLKSVYRSVIAWKHRYPLVKWERWPSRRDAERYVFRTLERFWNERERVKA